MATTKRYTAEDLLEMGSHVRMVAAVYDCVTINRSTRSPDSVDGSLIMATSKLLTAEDVWNMEDDGCRHELIRGELLTMSPAARPHGKHLTELARQIGNYLAERPIAEAYTGDTGFILSRNPDVLLAPDLSVIRAERLPDNPPETGFEELVPDLVIEIISPSERVGQINAKVDAYLEAGVQLIWLIDPMRQSVTVHTPDDRVHVLEGTDEIDGGDVLPEFRLSLAELFR